MSSEFDKLLAKVKKMNTIKGHECMICHFPDKKSNLIKLDCSHYYHKNCLTIKENSYVICPYCKGKTKWNENKLKPKPKKLCFAIVKSGANKGMVCGRTNCKYHKTMDPIEPTNLCSAIIKSGLKKGLVCGRNNCKYHKPIINVVV